MDLFSDGGDGIKFMLVPLFIAGCAVLLFGALMFGVVRGLIQWSRNDHSPLITVPASVITKRGLRSGGTPDSPPTTSYYATFQLRRDGERLEYQVSGREFGMLAERDRGELSYQGTCYKGFRRTPQNW